MKRIKVRPGPLSFSAARPVPRRERLPPTEAGFFLLYFFGLYRPIGRFFLKNLGVRTVFTWLAAVAAAVALASR